MQALLHSMPPNPATGHRWPIPSVETPGYSQASLGQFFSLLIYKMNFTHLWNLQFWWSHYFKLMRWYMWKQLENAKCFNKVQCLRKSLITPKSDEKSSWFHWHLAYDKGGKTENCSTNGFREVHSSKSGNGFPAIPTAGKTGRVKNDN